MGYFSSDLGSQFLGGDRTEKNFLVGSTKYIRILVGSRGPILRGGPDRSPTSHKGSDRTLFFVGSRVSMSGGGIGPKCGFVVSILFFLKGSKLTLFSHVPYSWGVEGAMFSDPGSSL